MSESKTFAVFSRRLATHLMRKGFVLSHTNKNFNKPDRKVFYFFNSEKLRAAVDEYMEVVRDAKHSRGR